MGLSNGPHYGPGKITLSHCQENLIAFEYTVLGAAVGGFLGGGPVGALYAVVSVLPGAYMSFMGTGCAD